MIQNFITTALNAVDPVRAMQRWLVRDGDGLRCGDWAWRYDQTRRVFVVGGGKAGALMAHAVAELIGDWQPHGIVVVKDNHRPELNYGMIEVVEAAHPTPDQRSIHATQRMTTLLDQAQPDDLVLVLFSGGASALLASPVATISLHDLQIITNLLLASGAPIQAINAIRKHCETLKGGQLAQRAMPAHVLGLIISDVVGSPLDVIASGMTVPDPTTYSDALNILDQFHISKHVPRSILDHLHAGANGAIAETPKSLPSMVHNQIIARNEDALHAVAESAHSHRFHVEILPPFEGEARHVGQQFGAMLRQRTSMITQPTLFLAGGETTVTFDQPDPTAHGGRNQELALAAAFAIAGLNHVSVIALATDGGDGNSPAAGAIATGTTIQRLRDIGLDPETLLDTHNSFVAWQALGDALMLQPTLTNVNDVLMGIVWKEE